MESGGRGEGEATNDPSFTSARTPLRTLHRAGREVLVVEAEKSFGTQTSARNSEVGGREGGKEGGREGGKKVG